MSDSLVPALLREYGQAMRSDWGSIDGRCVRADLEDLANELEHPTDRDLSEWRRKLDLCSWGHQHWTSWCDSDCTNQ